MKVRALEHLQEFRVGKVLLACVLIRGLNESAVADVFALADTYKRIVRIVKFRAQGHNGRFVDESSPYRTSEIIDLLKPYVSPAQFLRAVKLSGHLEGRSYSPDPRCKGKSCCFHFQPHSRLEVNILECFTGQGICWRKGRLNSDFKIEPVFESYELAVDRSGV